MKNNKKIIENTPLFEGLPDEHLDKIARITASRSYNKGELIFTEGDKGDGFYIVAEGKVKIFKMSSEGKEQILHIFGPGEPFGEVPVFSGKSFPASAQALSKSRLLFFPRNAFMELVMEDPSLSLNMMAVLAMRLRQFAMQIENLSLKEVPGRLAAYLVFLSQEQNNPDTVTLTISKGQLASLLGTIPETLSRIFAKMTGQGLIKVDGKTIGLTDRPQLEDLAEHGKSME